MLKVNDKQLETVLNDQNDVTNLNLIRKHLRRQFTGIMPKRYYIFPRDPKVYRMSKSICIEMPSWGNRSYRLALATLERELKKSFICDTQYYDGNTTFVVRECRN